MTGRASPSVVIAAEATDDPHVAAIQVQRKLVETEPQKRREEPRERGSSCASEESSCFSALVIECLPY